MSPTLITLLEVATTLGAVFSCAFQCYAYAIVGDTAAPAALDEPPSISWPAAAGSH